MLLDNIHREHAVMHVIMYSISLYISQKKIIIISVYP